MRYGIFGFIGLVWLLGSGQPVLAEHRQQIVCGSENYRLQRCPLPVDGRVELHRQLSDSPCIAGVSWGVNHRGLWVDRGCRAEFSVEVARAGERSLVCKSENYRYQRCHARIYGNVRLERQYSDSPCIFKRSWGYDQFGIWVDNGCQGRFSFGGHDSDDDYVSVPPARSGPPPGRIITCRSKDYRYQFCRANTRGGVVLQKQLSDAPCDKGRTWGFEKSGIWVKAGCSGQFRIGG